MYKLHSQEWSLFIIERYFMETGHFYFISDQYFLDFPDPKLMNNKETVNGKNHDRPCFCAFEDHNTGLYWMIPISSRVNKYREYYNTKIATYGRCDTFAFGQVLGHEKAFLIQNMCPVTTKYIKNEYIDKISNTPVLLDGVFQRELFEKARRVLALQRKGIKLIFPDVLDIERKILSK